MPGVEMTFTAWLWVGAIVLDLVVFAYGVCLATIGVYLLWAWYPGVATIVAALIVGAVFLYMFIRRPPWPNTW
ncbi:hypothetical protein, partial [Escherichia coli]|uniref:hypothetical protein n=1 Tax=Escherichia coli TaxID=562 RepID=UPI003F767B7F|nr:hypothetical protein [Escherichia coli]